MLRENRLVAALDPATARGSGEETSSEAGTGTLDRFLSENSDKVAVRWDMDTNNNTYLLTWLYFRRFSSLPPGAQYTYGRGNPARKLKYMGSQNVNKNQEQTPTTWTCTLHTCCFLNVQCYTVNLHAMFFIYDYDSQKDNIPLQGALGKISRKMYKTVF